LKYATHFGIAAALLLILFCFFPWAYYPDLQENFTGFYSKQNNYGKPGKTFIFLSVVSIVLFILPKLWAKRFNQFIGVLILAYALKTYVVYAGSYAGNYPVIKPGLIGVLICSVIIIICSLLSKAEIKANS